MPSSQEAIENPGFSEIKLSVLIATFQPQGIERVATMDLPKVKNVEYVVSWQEHGDAPIPAQLGERQDVRIFRFGQSGVSNNRNNALTKARGKIVLTADDDLRYTEGQLQSVIRVFEENPQIDLASFKYAGTDNKFYPEKECDLSKLPSGFYSTAFELAWRRNSRTESLIFDTSFGPGSKYLAGAEDGMLLLTARRMGLACRFFPITITTHDGLTTGRRRITNSAFIRSEGAYMALAYPLTCLPRLILKAWRWKRLKQSSFVKSVYHLVWGAVYAASVVTPVWSQKH